MFAIGIPWSPDLLQLGGFRFTWHSLSAVLGILAGVYVARRLGRRTSISDDDVTTLALWGVGGGIVMARLLFVIDSWQVYSQDFGRAFNLAEGGITVWGAPIGGGIAIALVAWWKHLPVPPALDIAAPGLMLGMAIGRVGDLINGEHLARASDLPWAVFYTHADTLGQGPLTPGRGPFPVHPATTYELLGNLIILGVALWLTRRHIGTGYIFWLVLAGYGSLRLGLQFLRIDQPEHIWGLQQSQIIAILGLLATAVWLTRRVIVRSTREPVQAPPGNRDRRRRRRR